MDLDARIDKLSDFAAVAVCGRLAEALLADPRFSVEDAIGRLPPEVGAGTDAAALGKGLDDEKYHLALPREVAVPLARSVLHAAAKSPELAPALEAALDDGADTKQFAVEVLALGAAISMVIFASTTTVADGKLGKTSLSAELAKELGGWLNALKPWATGDKAN